MFVKVTSGTIENVISEIARSGFFPIEGFNPDELRFDNFQSAVFTGEKVIVSPPIERSLEEAKAWLKNRAYQATKEIQDNFFKKYSNAEMVTFLQKKKEAQLLQQSGNPSDAPMLVAIAQEIAERSGNDFNNALEELKGSILAKIGFEEFMAKTEASRKAKALSIEAASSIEELAAFYYSAEWSDGWHG